MVNYIIPINQNIANAIGLEPALVLQQIEYWMSKCGRTIQEEQGSWIYNSLEEWHKQFSFWSLSKLRRIFKSLETQRLIVSRKINSKKWNQTKWYSINLDQYNKLFDNKISLDKKRTDRSVQNEQMYKEETKNNYTKNSSLTNEVQIVISKKETDIAKTMLSTWDKTFEYSLKPIKGYLTRKIIFQLNKVFKSEFSSNMEHWEDYVKQVNSSKFLMGEKETKNNFKAQFAWLIKEETITAIQQGAYGVGDRLLDTDNVEQNLQDREKEVSTSFKQKLAEIIKQQTSGEQEEQEFKAYMLSRKYKHDGDRYGVSKHMEEIGKSYMYGEYITASHIFYPGNTAYKDRIFKSYLMKKYLNKDEMMVNSSVSEFLRNKKRCGGLLSVLGHIKDKIENIRIGELKTCPGLEIASIL